MHINLACGKAHYHLKLEIFNVKVRAGEGKAFIGCSGHVYRKWAGAFSYYKDVGVCKGKWYQLFNCAVTLAKVAMVSLWSKIVLQLLQLAILAVWYFTTDPEPTLYLRCGLRYFSRNPRELRSMEATVKTHTRMLISRRAESNTC